MIDTFRHLFWTKVSADFYYCELVYNDWCITGVLRCAQVIVGVIVAAYVIWLLWWRRRRT